MAKKEKLDYTALIRRLRAEGPGKLYLLWGEETYLREQFTSELRRACLGDAPDDFDYKRFNGENIDLRLLSEAVDSMPFFAERVYIELRGFDLNKCKAEDAETLKELFSTLPDFCTLAILLPTAGEPDGRLSLYKTLRKHGEIIEFTPQAHSQLVRWIQRRAEAGGKTISPADAEYLMFNCGELMSHLGNEIAKLTHYCRGEAITRADIDAVTDRSLEATVFQMTDALAARDYNAASASLAELLEKQESPIMLLAMMGRQFRQLLIARVALDCRLGRDYLASVCGTQSEFVLRKLSSAARGFTQDQLRHAVRLCAETDYAMKRSSAEDETLLCNLLLKLALGGAA